MNFMNTRDMYCQEDMYCRDEEIPFMPENPILGRAYVPFQELGCLFNPVKGLSAGTIFPELVRPYIKEKDNCGCCRRDRK